MTTLLSEVVDLLQRRESPHAVIGAAALAVLGVSRSTLDLDILTTDRATLRRDYWLDVGHADTSVEIRTGDISDPLVGVVRLSRGDERPVDIIVGEGRWQERIIAEARPHTLAGVDVPVVNSVGVILMKLYAGGSQDLWDIAQLLAVIPDPEGFAGTISARVAELPMRCQSLWERVSGG